VRSEKVFHIFAAPCFVEMPGLPQLWKSLWDSHNCLENSTSFPQSFGKAKKQLFHISTKPFIFYKYMIYNNGNYHCRQREKINVAGQKLEIFCISLKKRYLRGRK
jgi:hypothetical protein